MKIIKNKVHLEKIIREYGKFAFADVLINDDMINFIVKEFVIGDYDTYRNNKKDELVKTFMKHFKQFRYNVCDIENKPVLGNGTYGKVCEYDPTKIIKIFRYDEKEEFTDSMLEDPDVLWVLVRPTMLEFVDYVIRMALLRFIDCTISDDQNVIDYCNKSDISKMNEAVSTYFNILSLSSTMGVISRPFYKFTESMMNGNKTTFGYIMVKYEITFNKVFDTRSDFDCAKILYRIVDTLERLASTEDIGIILSHRDFKPDNIMLTKQINQVDNTSLELIKFIDFGFMCTFVDFEDGGSWKIGFHPFADNDPRLNQCTDPDHDIVFLIAYLIKYYPRFLNSLNIYKDFVELIDFTVDRMASINKNINILWVYGLVYNVDTTDIYNKIMSILAEVLAEKMTNIEIQNILLPEQSIDMQKLYERNKQKYISLYEINDASKSA